MSNFNVNAFLSLTEEDKEKVEHIYIIAAILADHRAKPLDTKDFDRLYDMPVSELERISGQILLRHVCDTMHEGE